MRRTPLKKVLYNYTSLLMVSSSLTFEVPRFKALQLQGPAIFARCRRFGSRRPYHLNTNIRI